MGRITATAVLLAIGAMASSEVNADTRSKEYTSMSLPEQKAFSEVSRKCHDDVQRMCVQKNRHPFAPMGLESPRHMQAEHPFFTFHRNPLQDFDAFFDRIMVETAPLVQIMTEGTPDFILVVGEEPMPPPPRQLKKNPCPFDTMLQQVVSGVHPMDFPTVTTLLNEKGNDMLTTPDTEHFAVARRLQEVSADHLHSVRRSFLPFEGDCLERAFLAHKTFPPCSEALQNLHALRAHELKVLQQEFANGWNQMTGLFQLYAVIFFVVVASFLKHLKTRPEMKLRMRRRILFGVYYSPSLKAMVENEVGPIGDEPPLFSSYFSLHSALTELADSRLMTFLRRFLVACLVFYCATVLLVPPEIIPVVSFEVSMYAFMVPVMCIVFFIAQKKRASFNQMVQQHERILYAIYSKPSLKLSVERELGCLGAVPPLPLYRLAMRGAVRDQTKEKRALFRRFRCFVLGLLACAFLLAPEFVLPVCTAMVLLMFWVVSVSKIKQPEDQCVCCCCNCSPATVMNGTLTVEQTCCKCCSGTGVCCLDCKCNEVLNNKKYDYYSDENMDEIAQDGVQSGVENDCSEMKKRIRRTVLSVNDDNIYTGVPVQIV